MVSAVLPAVWCSIKKVIQCGPYALNRALILVSLTLFLLVLEVVSQNLAWILRLGLGLSY